MCWTREYFDVPLFCNQIFCYKILYLYNKWVYNFATYNCVFISNEFPSYRCSNRENWKQQFCTSSTDKLIIYSGCYSLFHNSAVRAYLWPKVYQIKVLAVVVTSLLLVWFYKHVLLIPSTPSTLVSIQLISIQCQISHFRPASVYHSFADRDKSWSYSVRVPALDVELKL